MQNKYTVCIYIRSEWGWNQEMQGRSEVETCTLLYCSVTLWLYCSIVLLFHCSITLLLYCFLALLLSLHRWVGKSYCPLVLSSSWFGWVGSLTFICTCSFAFTCTFHYRICFLWRTPLAAHQWFFKTREPVSGCTCFFFLLCLLGGLAPDPTRSSHGTVSAL